MRRNLLYEHIRRKKYFRYLNNIKQIRELSADATEFLVRMEHHLRQLTDPHLSRTCRVLWHYVHAERMSKRTINKAMCIIQAYVNVVSVERVMVDTAKSIVLEYWNRYDNPGILFREDILRMYKSFRRERDKDIIRRVYKRFIQQKHLTDPIFSIDFNSEGE